MGDPPRRIEISWVQAVAGALAAVSSAVLLSTVGVAGTVIGAALGSVAATVGSAVYGHYLAASRDRVAAAAAARASVRRAQDVVADGAGVADVAELDDDATRETGAAGDTHPWRAAVHGLRWRRIVLTAGVIFVVAMSAILTFELVAGRAVSTYTGGSDTDGPRVSVPGVDGGDDESEPSPSPSPSPATATSEAPLGSPSAMPSTVPSVASSTGSSAGPSTPATSPSASTSSALPAGPSPSPVPPG